MSLVLLGVFTTPLATALAAAAVLAYSVLYTMVLKRRTHHNTVFGGLPGAAPVLIGWAAVTGSLDWPAVVFFGIVFCWQMPHFWALASRFRYDYFRAGVPMLSVVAGPVSVGRQSVAWAWGTLAVSLLMVPVTPQLGWITGVATLGLGAWYVAESHAWLNRITARRARPPDAAVLGVDHLHDAALDRPGRRRPRSLDGDGRAASPQRPRSHGTGGPRSPRR